MRVVAALAASAAVATLWLPARRVRIHGGRRAAAIAGGVAAAALTAVVLVDAGAPVAIAVAGGALASPVPSAVLRARRRREATRLAERWPDFLAAIRSRVAGGAPLPEATRAAGRHIGGQFAELDVGPAIAFDTLMRATQVRWEDPIADRVCTTLAAATVIGGGRVDDILGRLAESIAAELRLRRAHDAAITQQRLTAGVALLAPWAILALSLATNPTAAEAYSTPTGGAIVLGGLATTTAGYVLAARAARLSRPPRLFS